MLEIRLVIKTENFPLIDVAKVESFIEIIWDITRFNHQYSMEQ